MKRWNPKPREPHYTAAEHNFKDSRSKALWRSNRIVLFGQDKTDLRRAVYQRAGGKCEIEWNGRRCNRYAPWSGIGHGELVHIVASAHGGSDSLENCQWGCGGRDGCHARRDHPGPQFATQRSRRDKEAAALPPSAA